MPKRKSPEETGGSFPSRTAASENVADHSPLARFLLCQYLLGRISLPFLQEVVTLAYDEPSKHPDMLNLKNCVSGVQIGTCKKSLFRQLFRSPLESAIASIAVPIMLAGKRVQVEISMVYPHLFFHALFHNYPAVFRDKMYNNLPHAVTEFWESQKDHPSYADHPVHKVDKSKAIPLLMHGDEVAVVGLGKIWSRGADCVSFGSLLAGPKNGFEKHMVIWMLYNVLRAPVVDGVGAMSLLWRHLVWSLYWLQLGLFPDRDPHGFLYTAADGIDYDRRLQPLAGGWSGQLWAKQMDNEYQRNTFHLCAEREGRHCAWCRASVSGPLV